jgi:hypothetical protein
MFLCVRGIDYYDFLFDCGTVLSSIFLFCFCFMKSRKWQSHWIYRIRGLKLIHWLLKINLIFERKIEDDEVHIFWQYFVPDWTLEHQNTRTLCKLFCSKIIIMTMLILQQCTRHMSWSHSNSDVNILYPIDVKH